MTVNRIPRPGRWRLVLAVLSLCCCSLISSRAQSVTLAWTPGASSGIAGYYLLFGTNSGNLTSTIDVGTNTTVTVSGLVPGQTYYFEVEAYDSARILSPPSNVASFLVPVTTPPAPSGAQLAVVSPASGPPGTPVYIYGSGLSSASSVRFNGVSAQFNISSDGLLVATVPTTATSGSLAITTSSGVAVANFVVVPGVPPANDNFNNAQSLGGSFSIASTNTVGATKQSGEPNHAGNSGGSSVWYRWTAPATGQWSLDSIGSSFTTLLAVYTGNAVSSLSLVSNNLSAGHLTNSFTFNATAGVTYQIAADGYNGAVGSLVLHLEPFTPIATVYATTFESTGGFFSSLPLGGESGWISQGTAGNGIDLNIFPGYGQQAFIGFTSLSPAVNSLLYVPLNYTVNTNNGPIITFSVMMQIDASVLSSYNSIFAWVVRNTAGHECFRLSFDDYTKAINYSLDDGNGPVYTGFSFSDSAAYNLVLTMDYAHNVWSASLNGSTFVFQKPITTSGAAMTLGDIDASESFRVLSQPGSDGMVFDNYSITAGPSPSPVIVQAPQSQTVSAGNNAFLGALAAGAPPLVYQWYFNNNPITNATNASLMLTGLTPAQTGSYVLVAANAYGGVSTSATIAVTSPPAKSAFVGRFSLGTGGALLNLNVAAGNNYRLLVSTNLHTWTTLNSFFAPVPMQYVLTPRPTPPATAFTAWCRPDVRAARSIPKNTASWR